MRRSPDITLSSLLVFVAVLVWLTAFPAEHGVLAPTSLTGGTCQPAPDTTPRPGPHDARPRVSTASSEPRRILSAGSDLEGRRRTPAFGRSPSDLVRVHGAVRWRGLPFTDYDLTFRATGAQPDDIENAWDFTDENGHFEVELPVGTYVVLNDADDTDDWTTNLVVPEGNAQLVIDFVLP